MFWIFIALLVAWGVAAYLDWDGWAFILFCAMVVVGIKGCNDSEFYQDSLRAEEAQRRADATPRVIREFDGCKVYTFKAGEKWHYVTKCPTSTTTERSYSESCGKNRTCERKEVIVTENQ